jgi:hypothetical protein
MKEITALKLTCVGAFVATLGVGCASTGYARYDADRTDMDQGVGVSASADVGTDRSTIVHTDSDKTTAVHTDADRDHIVLVDGDHDSTLVVPDTEGEERITVSALSFSPETRATWVNRFPFYDNNWRLRTIDTYTFAVPEDVNLKDNDREFSASMPSGTVFVEAAGGAGEVRTGRIIQHSPSPTR